MEAIRLKPSLYMPFGTEFLYKDYSGYDRGVNSGGTESRGLPLIPESTYSQRLGNGRYLGTTALNFVRGSESKSFSVSAVVYPIGTTGKIGVVSHLDTMDGLVIDGTKVSFSTEYLNTGVASASYDVQTIKRLDVVGVHSQNKNSLYVDGVLVAEVDITAEQQKDIYKDASTLLGHGYQAAPSTKLMLLNGLGHWTRALSSEEVASLYRANSRRALGSIPKMYGAEDVLVSTAVRPLFLDTGWNTEEDWKAAMLDNVVVDDGQLHATMFEGLTQSGTWTDSVDLYTGETPVAINSVNLWWTGVGETVEASVDGINWSAVTKGQNLSIIPTGFDPTNKELYIRVTFASGLESAYIDSMQVNGYTTSTAMSANRIITYNNPAVVFDERHPADMLDDWGVRLGTGGSVVIGTDTISETPTALRTLEVWVKPDTGYSIGNATGFSYFVNGESQSVVAGEWNIVHYVFNSNVTTDVYLNGKATIGKVAIYDTALTQAQTKTIISNYLGVNTLRYDGTGTLTLSEPATPAVIYAHDWEITAS